MPTQGIDFAALSLMDALDLAVLIEEEARERYEEFAHQMDVHHTPEAARFFRFMAKNEEKHRAELAARRRELFGGAPRAVRREMLFDVEAPEYDEARASMTARQALGSALRSEKKAHQFFVDALPHLTDPKAKALFEELRDEEIFHEQLVQKELERAPADPRFGAEEFEDEPTGQD
jgi:rubrerythrin